MVPKNRCKSQPTLRLQPLEPNLGSSWREVPQRKACPRKSPSPGKGEHAQVEGHNWQHSGRLVSTRRHGPPSAPPRGAVHGASLLQAGHAVWRAKAGVPLADHSRQRFRCRESVTPGDQADLPSREHLRVFLAGSAWDLGPLGPRLKIKYRYSSVPAARAPRKPSLDTS